MSGMGWMPAPGIDCQALKQTGPKDLLVLLLSLICCLMEAKKFQRKKQSFQFVDISFE